MDSFKEKVEALDEQDDSSTRSWVRVQWEAESGKASLTLQ